MTGRIDGRGAHQDWRWEAVMGNSELEARRRQAVSRAVGVTTEIYAARAENAEIW
ncbi:hypothetical protein FHS53_003121, partial [Xanthobacter tagetidis]|nr:hypothetical protein [Xanthobacter tagetidis]